MYFSTLFNKIFFSNTMNQYINSNYLTFQLGRACKQCGEPIADQEHSTREFCDKYYDEYGKVYDCKTSYHRERDKPERDAQRDLINFHKEMAIRIHQLYTNRGDIVKTGDLDAFNILLTKSIEFGISENGEMTSIFMGFKIITNPLTNNHKIIQYDK